MVKWSTFIRGRPAWSGLEHLPCEKSLREGSWFRSKKRPLWGGPKSIPTITCREVTKKIDPGSSHEYVARSVTKGIMLKEGGSH